MRTVLWFVVVLLLGSVGAFAQNGVKKRKVMPYEYGAVVINNHSTQAGMVPVTFDHWIHRRHYTCRVCHVDIGFGMTGGSTNIRAADNEKGYFCGTCHNGKMIFDSKPLFSACDQSKRSIATGVKNCKYCHVVGVSSEKEEAFHRFAENMPAEKFGNGINWEKAEESGRIKLLDRIDGITSVASMKVAADFSLKAKVQGMPDIIFSHTKHTVWNGCEVCHPDIFVGVKAGTTKYTMIDLFQGRYCGACHDKVAFPQTDCKRCHAKPV